VKPINSATSSGATSEDRATAKHSRAEPAFCNPSRQNPRSALNPSFDTLHEFHRRQYGWEGSPIHDAVAIAHVVRPDLLETLERGVKVDTGRS